MGELDEKESAPANAPTTTTPTADVISVDEPKETETLLAANTDTKSVADSIGAVVAAAIESPKSSTSTTVTIEKEPEEIAVTPTQAAAVIIASADGGDDDKEKEKLLPAAAATASAAAATTTTNVTPEGREVKPKKIPIGGIKMPGFFTKNKPKAEGDGADGELLEKTPTTTAATDLEAAKDDNAAKVDEVAVGDAEESDKASRPAGFFAALRNIRNPFAKRQPVKTSDDAEGDGEVKEIKLDDGTHGTDAKPAADGDGDHNNDTAAPPTKKGLLNAIRLPIVNMIPKKLRPVNGSAAAADTEDVELGNGSNSGGNGPHNKAGLASMETLDDSLKDTDNGKDVTDKSATIKADDMETIKLTAAEAGADKDGAQQDKANEAAGTGKPSVSLVETLRAYRCSIDDMAIAGGLLVFLLLVGVICAFTFTGHGEQRSAPVRDGRFVDAYTTCGPAEGQLEDSAFAFRGIPYALSPTGDRRFRPAQPIDHIDHCWNGTFRAHDSGPVCVQRDANGTVHGDEDCLRLDVITPHVRYDNPLPVVVLFGADTYGGQSPGVLRPSARFARKNDVIFVRPNFRMGVLGFLALDILNQDVHPPTSGNYALSDMLAALQWVRLNIAHFGGNPDAVTLFGHRTGATLVSALVTSDRARGLYARAWVSSGAALFPGKPLADSQVTHRQLLLATGCTTVACLRKLDAASVVNATPAAWTTLAQSELPARDEQASRRHEWLVLDGEILRQNPVDHLNREATGTPRLVIGTTRHAAHTDQLQHSQNWTAEAVRAYVERSRVGEQNLTEEALERYGATYAGLVAMISDIRTVCPLLTIARLQPTVPFYVVTQLGDDSNEPLARVDDDVLAILGRYEPHTPEQRRYVSAIQQLFYHYVSHGAMPQYEVRQRVLDIGQDVLSKPDYTNCDFWINADMVLRYARTY